VFKKDHSDRSICRSVNISTHIDRWTGQYPILAYTTWRDLNQSQPHISMRGITNSFIWGCRTQPYTQQQPS